MNLATLPVVFRNGQPVQQKSPVAQPTSSNNATQPEATTDTSQTETQTGIINAIARLGELKEKGILTDEEFTAKKAELLARL